MTGVKSYADRKPRRFFTPEEDARLLAMLAEGAGNADIAIALERDGPTICHRLRRLRQKMTASERQACQARARARRLSNLRGKGPKWTESEVDRVMKDYAANVPVTETAQALGRSLSAVMNKRQVVQRASLSPAERKEATAQARAMGANAPNWSKAEVDRLLRDYADRVLRADTAAALGRSLHAVNTKLQDLRVRGKMAEAALRRQRARGTVKVKAPAKVRTPARAKVPVKAKALPAQKVAKAKPKAVPAVKMAIVPWQAPPFGAAMGPLRRDISDHLNTLGYAAPFGPEVDYRLAYDHFAGHPMQSIAARLQLSVGEARERLVGITRPFRVPTYFAPYFLLKIEDQTAILAVLRARAAHSAEVAA